MAAQPDLEMLAVSAVEANPPAGAKPASWLLLASGGEACTEDAVETVRRYRKRWTVKELFRVLKTGLRVEERRFDRAENLRECLAFDAATACRVFDIVPEDASRILEIALESCGARPRAPPNPTIRESAVELARIAGFQASKRQPLPGILKLRSAWAIFAPHMQYHRTMEAKGMINELVSERKPLNSLNFLTESLDFACEESQDLA